MKPNLECKLLLKTNTYLPEIPNYWLDSTNFPTFDSNTYEIKSKEISAIDAVIDSTQIGNGPFTSACYSEDGEILAVSNLEGIYILGSYTRTCFAAIPFGLLKKELKIEDSVPLICNDIYIFGRNCLLGALFSEHIVFWDLFSKKFNNYECYLPNFIGSFSNKDLFLHINQKQQLYNYLPPQYFNMIDPGDFERNKFVSIQGIKTNHERDATKTESQNTIIIEFVLELFNSLPLLVQTKTKYINQNELKNELLDKSSIQQEFTIHSVSSVFPDYMLNNISTKYVDFKNNNKLVSLAVFEKEDHRVYSSFVIIGETNVLLVFDEFKTILSLKTIPSYGKRHNKYLYSCNLQFNKDGDILVLQYSDRFTVYSLKQIDDSKSKDNFRADSDLKQVNDLTESENYNDTDDESDQEYLTVLGIKSEKYVPTIKIKLLYSYSQVIQKEWITSISIYNEKIYDSHQICTDKLYGPISQLYPCGVLAITTISSNGQSFYYLMKTCSNSDDRSYVPNSLNIKCDHYCNDNTGSNMIIWKLELTKLNGVRKIIWQPGDSICLAIQFSERLKNTKLMYDDYYEMNSKNASLLTHIDKNNIFGKIFFIDSRCSNDDMLLWSRLMEDFIAIHKNKEYIEKEDEFDKVDEKQDNSELDEIKKTFLDEYYKVVSKQDTHQQGYNEIQIQKFSEDLHEFNKNLDKKVYWFDINRKV
ncbi:unnamed protein product [Cryptosporidium hominis]|uniref:Transcription initiation factor TFIID subunit n=2 Tax=Cryptosporidium hominis TaxID=237895 RepID=A0A0S4TEN2_CRYHO|nr:hypothetical protein ChTU502y2012_416g0245 [Cryptosporidium hominis]PPA64943.1 hypothetical protein ChUKH1_03120 [Cryptosporidium hominis]PPS94575.1 Transcription initiation factor TFIID subunit [Cryptosporidium hominis]CUV05351.1 unnamed protein product [Cryptosporidium hominis]|eukprot:PPS94575.1 Transcription initiation factor TFIID subunit [Cryptosporidium hominis]